MGALRKMSGAMRDRFVDTGQMLHAFIKSPGEFEGYDACMVNLAIIALVAMALLAVLYGAGRIAYDFTLAPGERSSAESAPAAVDVDLQEPGEPFMDGRHFAIFGVGEAEARRVYTFELVGEGDSGTVRVWEDATGSGTFTITGDAIRIEMQRMVPPENPEIAEPNFFEGTLSADGSRIDGTWSREGWSGIPGEMALDGTTESVKFYAERL